MAPTAIREWRDLVALSEHGVQTTGVVTTLLPNIHSSIEYQYRVGGSIYTDTTITGKSGVPHVWTLHPGDHILVTYLPGDPSKAIGGDPADLEAEWWGLAFVILPVGCILIGFLGTRVKARDRTIR
jgi:hypothetical protein